MWLYLAEGGLMHAFFITQQVKDGSNVLVLQLADKHTINKTMFLKPVSSKSTETKKQEQKQHPPPKLVGVFSCLSHLWNFLFSPLIPLVYCEILAGTHFVDQDDLELVEVCLPLSAG